MSDARDDDHELYRYGLSIVERVLGGGSRVLPETRAAQKPATTTAPTTATATATSSAAAAKADEDESDEDESDEDESDDETEEGSDEEGGETVSATTADGASLAVSFADGGELVVRHEGLPADAQCYIAVAHADHPVERRITTMNVKGKAAGETRHGRLPAGRYVARLSVKDLNKVACELPFEVPDSAALRATVRLETTSYEPGKPIKVSFTAESPQQQDWIALVKPDARPFEYVCYQWLQKSGAGTVELNPGKNLAAGTYVARYFCRNSAAWAAESEALVVG